MMWRSSIVELRYSLRSSSRWVNIGIETVVEGWLLLGIVYSLVSLWILHSIHLINMTAFFNCWRCMSHFLIGTHFRIISRFRVRSLTSHIIRLHKLFHFFQVNRLFTANWTFLCWVTLLAVRNVESSLRRWHVHFIWETTSVFIYWNLFELPCVLVKFDCTLLCSMHWHSLVINADYITSIVLWREHSITVLRLRSTVNLASYLGLWNLNWPEMTPFELGNFLVNWFLRWFVLLQVARSRSLSIAVDKFVEVNHTSIIAT